jgi:hypothetical protein
MVQLFLPSPPAQDRRWRATWCRVHRAHDEDAQDLALERTKPLAEAGDLTSANARYLQLMDDDVDYWPQPVVRHGRVIGPYRRSR